MERKEKLLLTELIQDGAETVSDCITVLGVDEYLDVLGFDFEQSDIDGLRRRLTKFLAEGGSETHSEPYLFEHFASKNLTVYQANFAGVEIRWKEYADYLISYNPALFMVDAHVVL